MPLKCWYVEMGKNALILPTNNNNSNNNLLLHTKSQIAVQFLHKNIKVKRDWFEAKSTTRLNHWTIRSTQKRTIRQDINTTWHCCAAAPSYCLLLCRSYEMKQQDHYNDLNEKPTFSSLAIFYFARGGRRITWVGGAW